MDRKEILTAALKLEADGNAFYHDAAAAAPNEFARDMFESFAKDETNHITWINEFAEKEGISFTHTDWTEVHGIYDRLKGIFGDISEDLKDNLASSDSDIEQIDIAIGKEEEAIKAYGEFSEALVDDEAVKLFKTLVKVEKIHRELLNNAKTYLSSTGDWFMGEEQWSFDGG